MPEDVWVLEHKDYEEFVFSGYITHFSGEYNGLKNSKRCILESFVCTIWLIDLIQDLVSLCDWQNITGGSWKVECTQIYLVGNFFPTFYLVWGVKAIFYGLSLDVFIIHIKD